MYRVHQAEGLAVARSPLRGRRVAVALVVLAPLGMARADHAMPGGHHHDSSGVTAGVAVQAARFDNGIYAGGYQGIMPSVLWSHRWFRAAATVGLYHLTENGLDRYGVGDAAIAGHATVITTRTVDAGAALHVTAPTGAEPWFGMSHTMVMPSVWARWRRDRLTVTATTGYCRAVAEITASGEPGEHAHGGPIVDPMNMQELTWDAGVDVDVRGGVRIGGRALGAMPIGEGTTRVIGAGRVAWGTPRVSTGFELQLGLAGDPFTVRGVVDTALRF
jgi:hypothetical protein